MFNIDMNLEIAETFSTRVVAVSPVQRWSERASGSVTFGVQRVAPTARLSIDMTRARELRRLLGQVTDGNRHPEISTGGPVGEEVW